jgi:ribonuclease T1
LAGAFKLALAVVALCFIACSRAPVESKRSSEYKLPEGVPEKVARVLAHIDKYNKPPKGYVGGRTFTNRERRLPQADRDDKPIKYREWDVNRKVRGRNRGPERLVTGSDGSAYYTSDHYITFKKIR